MALIKFEMKGAYCKTKCPHGKAGNVNSNSCKYHCGYYAGVDKGAEEGDQAVICNFEIDQKSKVIKVGSGVMVSKAKEKIV